MPVSGRSNSVHCTCQPLLRRMPASAVRKTSIELAGQWRRRGPHPRSNRPTPSLDSSKCFASDENRRYLSAAAMAIELARIVTGWVPQKWAAPIARQCTYTHVRDDPAQRFNGDISNRKRRCHRSIFLACRTYDRRLRSSAMTGNIVDYEVTYELTRSASQTRRWRTQGLCDPGDRNRPPAN